MLGLTLGVGFAIAGLLCLPSPSFVVCGAHWYFSGVVKASHQLCHFWGLLGVALVQTQVLSVLDLWPPTI